MICASRVRDCLSLVVSFMYVKLLSFKVFTAYSSDQGCFFNPSQSKIAGTNGLHSANHISLRHYSKTHFTNLLAMRK